MSRAERRHSDRTAKARRIIEDLRTIHKVQEAISGDWPLQPGDKVKLNLNLKEITGRKNYQMLSPAYRAFCENNADRVFTVEYADGLSPGIVSLVDDESKPKWFFVSWDLEKVEPEAGGTS